MEIIAALFIDGIDIRQVPGPVDPHRPQRRPVLGAGPVAAAVHARAPSRRARPLPARTAPPTPRSRSSTPATASRWPATCSRSQVEPGKFNYRLVRAVLDFTDYGTVEAHCRLDMGPVTVVPFTVLPPVAAAAG